MAYEKRIRSQYLFGSFTVAMAATGAETTEHRWEDDGKIIGFEVQFSFGLPDVMNLGEGLADGYAYLSLNGDEDGTTGVLGVIQHRIHQAFEAFGVGGNLESNKRLVVMFPEGHGIEFKERDYIYLHGYGRDAAILAVGVLGIDYKALVYWVEKV